MLSALSFFFGWVPGASGESADYQTDNQAWNGLSALDAIAHDIGITVVVPEHLDMASVSPSDAVLIVSPTVDAPEDGLATFLKAGGRIALADDGEHGDPLLAAYHITRRTPQSANALRLRDNAALLVALPASMHPLTDGVRALVTNHPSSVAHPSLDAIFEFAPGDPVVLAGAVGDGRLIVIGDPSVLINEMLRLSGNERFARNLLQYLHAQPTGKLFIVTGNANIVGEFGQPDGPRSIARLRDALSHMAQMPLPGQAIHWFSILIAVVLVMSAWTSLPRRSPYEDQTLFPKALHVGGFVGRIRHFLRRDIAFNSPVLLYRSEFEHALLRHTQLARGSSLRAVLNELERRQFGEKIVGDARSLLIDLDAIAQKETDVLGQRVNDRAFEAYIARGEKILAALGEREMNEHSAHKSS